MIMPSLAEVQSRMRDAVVLGTEAEAVSLLTGGKSPAARLAIHHRHYQASLLETLLRRFPGVTWLVGESFMHAAAMEFIRWNPPSAPCIAEYAEEFPQFLARCPGADRLPYLMSFALLEWCLGKAALAVDYPAINIAQLSMLETSELPNIVLESQPGLHFLEAPWPVDELMNRFLGESQSDGFTLEETTIALQIVGARGDFQIKRLDPGTFSFRHAIARQFSLGEACHVAFETDPGFDPGRALAAIFSEGLIAGISPSRQEHLK